MHSNIPTLSVTTQTSLLSPWPFLQWSIDIEVPFSEALGKVKLLIVAVDYFTKWIYGDVVVSIAVKKSSSFYGDS